MLDVGPIARRLPRHFARAVLVVLTLGCLQAGVMRWGPPWLNMGTAEDGVAYVAEFSLSADRSRALTRVTIMHPGRRPAEHALFVEQTGGSGARQRLLPDRADISCAAIVRDGTRIAAATADGLVLILTLDSRQESVTRLDQIAPDFINHMQWTNDGSKLVAVGTDFIYVWLYPECRRLHKLPLNAGRTGRTGRTGRAGRAGLLELSSDSERLLLFHGDQCDAWHLTTGRQMKTVELPSYVHSVALSADSALAALALETDHFCVWDFQRGQEVWRSSATVYSTSRQSIAISPDDSLVASVHSRGGAAPQIVVRRLSDGASVATFDSGVGHVTGIAFVGETQLWICGSRGTQEGRSIPSGRELWRHDLARP